MNIKELAEDLGLEEDEYIELIELFIDRGMSDLDELEAAVGTGDSEKAMNAAHSIKGASGNLGLMEFYGTAKKMEDEAKDGNLEGVSGSIQVLQKEMEGIVALARG